MSDRITLTLRGRLDGTLTTAGLCPDTLAGLSHQQIASMTVWVGRQRAELGDFFSIDGERSDRVRIEGGTNAVDGLGAGMTRGELIIAGDAGARTGAGMSGGTIRVAGNVADAAGEQMSGGLLRIDGDAGDYLGAARPGASKGMTGGEILVLGSCGAEAAARLRRGLVVVAGSVGREAGRAMIAGSLIVFGTCGESPGLGSKRGTIVACGQVTVPATYRYACTFNPPHVRLTLTYLRRRHQLAIADDAVTGAYRRYCGDAGDPGKGEILELVPGV